MVGILSNSQELKTRRLRISQLLERRDLVNMLGVPLKVTSDDSNDDHGNYVVQGSFDSPLGGIITSISMEFDKTTMFLRNTKILGEYQALPFRQESNREYEFYEEPYYPLQVGKEGRVTQIETRTTTIMGKTRTETSRINYSYKVEGMEEITVPAGTFRCFKIVHYDDAGHAISTHYRSDRDTQYEVKSIDHETGEVIELISLESGMTESKESF